MSLAEYYNQNFGGEQIEKTAEAEQISEILSGLSEEECGSLSEAVDALEAEGAEFDTGVDKLAAAAEIVDSMNTGTEPTKEASEEAATEWEAAGRIMARAFDSELDNMSKEAAEGEAAKPSMKERAKAWMSAKGKSVEAKFPKTVAHMRTHGKKYAIGAGVAAGAGGLAAYMRRKKSKK